LGDIINPNNEQKRDSDKNYFFIVYSVRYNFTYQNNMNLNKYKKFKNPKDSNWLKKRVL
jgi:hypothetical protein